MFRNFITYRLPKGWAMPAGELEALLEKRPLQSCTALQTESRGWVASCPSRQLVYSAERHLLVELGIEKKLLPAGVVRRAVDERVAEFEKEKGVKAGRRQVRDIKDAVSVELLAQAFATRHTIAAWIDVERERIVVGTSSATAAETVITTLRDTLGGEFACAPYRFEISPSAKMSGWLAAKEAPPGFDLGEAAELVSADASRASIRYSRHTVELPEVVRHISEGKQVKQLSLQWKARMEITLDDRFQIKRATYLDIDFTEDQAALSSDQAFDQDFVLKTGLARQLIDDLLVAIPEEAESSSTPPSLAAAA